MEQLSFFIQGEWIIDIDTGEKFLRCSNCDSRYMLRAYLLASGSKGFRYCGYCGACMKNPNQKFLKWPEVYDSQDEPVDFHFL